MTRGRTANPEPAALPDNLNRAALAEDSAALTEMGRRSKAIAESYGDGLSYERNRIVGEARFYMSQSAEAMLELGKRLIQIKENEPHGDFTAILTERLGISMRSAQRMMQASAKYLSPLLASKATSVSLLGKSKMFDLIDESDEDIAALVDGGTLAGATLDEMAVMTRRELQEALKKERADRAKSDKAKQKVIDAKVHKLTELEEQLARRESAEPSELEQYQLDAVRDAATEAEQALRHLVGQVANVFDKPATPAAEANARHAAEFIAQVFSGLLLEASITVDFDEQVTPHWLVGADSAAEGKGRRGKRG